MTQRNFVLRREEFWNTLERVTGGGRREMRRSAAWFPAAFRELTQDLNTARAHGFDPAIIERLNRIVLAGNQLLYGGRPWSFKGIADFLLGGFPRAFRAEWKGIAAAHLLFYGLAFFVAFACIYFPDMAPEVLSPRMARELEAMYDPDNEYFLRPREVSSDADMFGYYIYNNVGIAFRAFGAGIVLGFGSLFILCFNAVILGGAAAHLINVGFSETFFSFISGHSSFELTAIVLSAQAGLLLGYRLFVTKGLSRAASLRAASKTALPLITGSSLLLVLAAAIEAFWSSRHEVSSFTHYSVGASLWVLLFGYFLFAGRGRRKGA
jgi:uncharacterized membrane protein SpoIIM required for sporulation